MKMFNAIPSLPWPMNFPFIVEKRELIHSRSVSYTHLDVYKRQATGGVFHLVNDVTLSARTRTDTDDNLVFLDYLHLRVRGSRSE